MSVDPTPPSHDLPEGSTEGTRAGTKTKFNFVALIGGLALVVVAFIAIYAFSSGGFTDADQGREASTAEASEFDTPLAPAKGDSPSDGDATDALNRRKDGPEDPGPGTAN